MWVFKKFYLILLLITIFFSATFFQIIKFSNHSKSLIETQTYFILREHAESNGKSLTLKIDQQFSFMESLATYIVQNEDISSIETFDYGENNIIYNSFDEMGLVDCNTGIATLKSGGLIDVSDKEFFKNTVKDIPYVRYIKGENQQDSKLLLSVPVYKEDEIVAVLFIMRDFSTFKNIRDDDFFGGESYVYLVNTKADIINLGHQKSIFDGRNNLSSYFESEDINVVPIIKNMQNGRTSSFAYTDSRGEMYFTAYSSMEYEDWYIFCSAPNDTITQFFEEFEHLGITIYLQLTVLFLSLGLIYYIRRIGAKIRKEHDQYKLAEEMAGIISFEGDYEKDSLSFTDNFFKLFGREPAFKKISDFTKPHPHVLDEDKDIFMKMGKDLISGKGFGEVEYRIICEDGSIQWHQFVYRVWHDKNGLPTKCFGMILVIDDQMKEISKLQMQAERDPLTGILNRNAFELYVSACFEDPLQSHALFLLDLDDFKQINDVHGHAMGDFALVKTSEVLKTSVRSSDYVGRLGGDEFVVFLKNATKEQATRKAAEICAELEHVQMDLGKGLITCSIGVACYPTNGDGFKELYEAADKELYKVKDTGKNSFSIAE